MRSIDVLKVLVLLALAIGATALICYARVDLGMSWGGMSLWLRSWMPQISDLALLVWSQILIAGAFGLARRIERVRAGEIE